MDTNTKWEYQNKYLLEVLKQHLNQEAFSWLTQHGEAPETVKLAQAFVMVPRKCGKDKINTSTQLMQQLATAGIEYISFWTIDRLARVWLLGAQSNNNGEEANQVIESLFRSAEVNEAVALYSALPFLSQPESWTKRCAEGIRSNLGPVLEAIIEDNPYPAKYLAESAWNQMVLKAFFTEKNITKINGLEDRANRQLALTLSDYARERYAAGRTIPAQLWPLTHAFIDDTIFEAMKIGLAGQDEDDKQAISAALLKSGYE